ncbi:flagellar protein FlaG [Colwellia sp. MSW7]|jgi:flagellar protein FlaG|uniref:Flagellar protein FlaG n=1 Tax=Colwellia maritima TaxID=2912588 RepID=A0ABS9X343_9GAMM|nr:flagellar protein FlaG [Colwellia maritima]MCI2284620.1 flagellar protein FlaG [Colwellia maritima]
MSAVQNGANLSLASLSPEFKKSEASESNNIENKIAVSDNEPKAIVNEQVNRVVHEPLTIQQLEKVAQQLQDFVGDMNRGLEFSVDKDSGRDVIKVIDKTSGDLLKQFPSEEVLTLVAKLSDMVGGFVDAKV